MKHLIKTLVLTLAALPGIFFAQNEARNWYFGYNAGLDFSTSPPTVLTNGQLRTDEGCASISNGAGNLLFYTDGIKVYNQTHALMANGTGLTGNTSSTQSAIIVKRPGSSIIYYIFTQDQLAGQAGLAYSEVNLSLAAGMGSVTVKNFTLFTPSCEKLTAIQHCNGIDIWVVSHDWNTASFRAYLVTAAGVSLSPVISNSGSSVTGNNQKALGQMKVSPNGDKLGLTIYDGTAGPVELHDFNASTGVVSNGFTLINSTSNYGCEFSPDGSKFYSGRVVDNTLFQWDICAGNHTSIINSLFTMTTTADFVGALQSAPDGKIYVARLYVPYISVINSPNLSGAACNYADMGISLGADTCELGLPNFINSYFKPVTTPAAFTYTSACSTYSFAAAALNGTATAGCNAVSNAVTGYLWNFGDPASGAANSSTLSNPIHAYPAVNSYTAQLITFYTCSSDTIRSLLSPTNASPNMSVTGTFTICNGDTRIYTAGGASSYTWSSTVHTASIALSPTITTGYSVTGTGSNSCTGNKSFTINVQPCTGLETLTQEQLFKVYPNPARENFSLETELPVFMRIFNQLGQTLFEEKFEKGTNRIDISGLSPGIYNIRLLIGETVTITRLVKTN